MTIQTIKKELRVLPHHQLQEIQSFIDLLIGEQAADTPIWAEHATDNITETEWKAMEEELEGVKNGTITALPLDHVIKTLKS